MNCYTIHMYPESPSTWDLYRLEGDNGIPLGVDLFSEDDNIFFYWENISSDVMRVGALYESQVGTFFISDVIVSKDCAEQMARDITAETIKFLRENKIGFRKHQDFRNFSRTVRYISMR